jgi:hypothetical protein
MKVKIIRQSGLPVDLTDLEKFKAEFRTAFDEAEQRIGKNMLLLQTEIQKIERSLQDKYPTVVEIELPTNSKKWKSAMTEYGNILVSSHRETGEIILVISDQEEVMY